MFELVCGSLMHANMFGSSGPRGEVKIELVARDYAEAYAFFSASIRATAEDPIVIETPHGGVIRFKP